MAQRIGVISDTHIVGEPGELFAPLARLWGEIDLILHAGDVTSPLVIATLERIAPTTVVAGNMDGVGGTAMWPRTTIVSLGRFAIGLTHGDLMRSMADMQPPARWRPSGRFDTAALHAYLRSQFPPVDAIVFGHTHRPHHMVDEGILFFNPGAFAGGYGRDAFRMVGVLTLDTHGIRGTHIRWQDQVATKAPSPR